MTLCPKLLEVIAVARMKRAADCARSDARQDATVHALAADCALTAWRYAKGWGFMRLAEREFTAEIEAAERKAAADQIRRPFA